MPPLIDTLIVVLAVLPAATLTLLALPDLYLLYIHLRQGHLRPDHLHPGTADDAAREPSDAATVCVQLVTHNEPAQVEAAIDAMAVLDWPAERLVIQVVDDSDDSTTRLAVDRIAYWRARGLDIRLLHRPHRHGFKAGALAAALTQTSATLIAIFDVDYRPPPDFLRRLATILVAQPTLAFVQARLEHRNRNANLLTRAQALELDMYFAFEQRARSLAGIPTPFNGTAGLWRRQAIDEAGGWSGATLVEDQDLSARAFAQGWRALHSNAIGAAGLLPESPGSLLQQRMRWAMGVGQNFHRLPWRRLGHLTWWQRGLFVLFSLFHATVMPLIALSVLVSAAVGLVNPTAMFAGFMALAVALATIVTCKSAGAALAYRTVQGRLDRRFALDLVAMWAMEAWLMPVLAWAATAGHLGRDRPFVRTPKGAG